MLDINFDFREAKIENPNNIKNLINPIHFKNITQNNQKYFNLITILKTYQRRQFLNLNNPKMVL